MAKKVEIPAEAVDFSGVQSAVDGVRQLLAGKASVAGVAARLAALNAQELALVALGTRQSESRLRDLARAAGAQLVT